MATDPKPVDAKPGANNNTRRPSRFYPLLTFGAWLVSGAAGVRWPQSLLGQSFTAMTVIFALVLNNAQMRSQDYYNRASKREDKGP